MRCFIAMLAAASLVVPNVAVADQFGCPQCRSCGGACVLKAEPVVEEETCYEVECQQVCIPAVRFPWDSCREPKCGRIRLVSVLKKESRETTACKYEWVVVCSRCGHIHKNGDGEPKVPPAPTPPASGEDPRPPAAPPASAMAPAARDPHLFANPQRVENQPFRLAGAESTVSSTR